VAPAPRLVRAALTALGRLIGAIEVLVLVLLAVMVLALVAGPILSVSWFDATPTTDTGKGETDELVDALADHGLRLPDDAADVTYRLHASIDSSEVGVRFRTTPDGLDEFLAADAFGGREPVAGVNPWDRARPDIVAGPRDHGWVVPPADDRAGLAIASTTDRGWSAVLVDLGDPDRPVVHAYDLSCC
jgi:hypothetical protein